MNLNSFSASHSCPAQGNSGHASWYQEFSSHDDRIRFMRIPAGGSAAEVARFTGAGDLLVGNTVVNPASGFSNQRGLGYDASTGQLQVATTANDVTMQLGRNKANDGPIVVFRKQSTTVGSIGTYSSRIYIGEGDTGLGISGSADAVFPVTAATGALRDAAIDLGLSNSRFKDLYLSGNARANTFSVGTVTVVDSSRNLTNISTITATGGGHTLSGGSTYINTGRGLVYLENNTNSNASGAGITLRTSSNPGSDDGSIFDVRSSGQAIRFYVGQNLTSSGYNPFYVGCGTTTGQGTASNYSIELAANGNIIAEGNITAYGSASDIRLKENIEPITDALSKVKRLDGVTFTYKKDGSRSTGVIAQQVQEVLPDVIYESAEVGKSEDGEKFLAVRYGQMMGLAIEAIKELSAEVDSLKAKLKELEDGNH